MGERRDPFVPGAYVYVGILTPEDPGVIGELVAIGGMGVVVNVEWTVKMERRDHMAFFPWSNVDRLTICPRPTEGGGDAD